MPNNIKAGVIGYPLGHSLSPLIHNYWIERYGLHGHYDAIEIVPGRLEQSVNKMIEDGYAGFNVTIPYKQDIMSLCDALSDTAQAVGAVNTVRVGERGRLHGHNTDSYGFAENIRRALPGRSFENKTALVLGAGGAALAVLHALGGMGLGEIRITNRTAEKARRAAQRFGASVINWDRREAAAQDVELLVNTTALGMTGQPELVFDLSHLPPQAAVCDIVYKPLHTDLLRQAQRRGNDIVTGIGMLLHQARPAFEGWFGVLPDVDEALQEKILEQAL
ncbi:MAG: shikimate dehydrogenase [Rhodospirillales bacterium]|nr:shikimate dehydrogenase [Rhodospirillales bacterium]MCB9997000.1 shikimate dehydrogenase [Rhodospirillales bacterium]